MFASCLLAVVCGAGVTIYAKQVDVPWETRLVVVNAQGAVPSAVFRRVTAALKDSIPLHSALNIDRGDIESMSADDSEIAKMVEDSSEEYGKVLVASVSVRMQTPPASSKIRELKAYLSLKPVPYYAVEFTLYDCRKKTSEMLFHESARSRGFSEVLNRGIAALHEAHIDMNQLTVADPVDLYRAYLGLGIGGICAQGILGRYASVGGGPAITGGVVNPWYIRQTVFLSLTASAVRPENGIMDRYVMSALMAGSDYRIFRWYRMSVWPAFSLGYISHIAPKGIYLDPSVSISIKGIYRFRGGVDYVYLKPSYTWFFEKNARGRFAGIEIGYQKKIDVPIARREETK